MISLVKMSEIEAMRTHGTKTHSKVNHTRVQTHTGQPGDLGRRGEGRGERVREGGGGRCVSAAQEAGM